MSTTIESANARRRIIKTATTTFDQYDLDGPVQRDMSQLSLSYDRKSGQGAYMVRMEPGAETIKHIHRRREEYLIIEGDLVEADGTELGPGDYVIYPPGSEHNSRTVNGCLLIGIDFNFTEHPEEWDSNG